MDWRRAEAPSLEEIETLAAEAFARLPDAFREACGPVLIRVEDFADEETLALMEIDDPFALSGLYVGVDRLSQGAEAMLTPTPVVTLYRRALLDEWAEGGTALGALIAHVIVHEIGHHFGFSDEDMERIEVAGED
ncbi:MAG: hypothetical protein GC199_00540 [Alphaproteobacteria bacterium]|nr:hypothetical protein [Alphaproteobacteria bacterium]